MGITWKPIPNNIASHADFDASLDHDFKEMGDFVYDDHNNQDKTKFPTKWQGQEYLESFWQTARGLIQYWKIQAPE